MNHVWGLFSHPDREMHVINSENESVSHHYTHHVLLMAAIPVVCAFIGTTQIGWNFGDGNILKLSLLTSLRWQFCSTGSCWQASPSWAGLFGGWRVIIRNVRRWRIVWCLPDMSRRRCFKRAGRTLSAGLAVRIGGDHCAVLHRLFTLSRHSDVPEYL